MNTDKPYMVGLISDTHGLLRPEALLALRGSDIIIHGGDVGGANILSELRGIAPVFAVRGNTDRGDFGRSLPHTQVVEARGTLLYVVHDIEDLDLDPSAAGIAAVIYGHSHQPGIAVKNGVLLINPGSAGPRRFSLPVTLGRLLISHHTCSPEIIHLTL